MLRFWRVNWILRVHIYLLIWRKTNFFSGISIVSLNQISKLTKLICLHFTGCRNYTKILTKHASYLILVTILLPSYLSIYHPLSQQSKIMLLSTVKLPSAIEMWIIFGPLKTPPRSSKSCGCETFRVLKYLLSIFLHYTHPCRMILSKKKCCLLLNGVSTESQKRTSVLQKRRDFSQTRHMTRISARLALSLVKLLLSSWKIYMCYLVTWYTNK